MVIMSVGDVAACLYTTYCVPSREVGRLPTSLLGTQYTYTDTSCCHIPDGHNYHFLTSFLHTTLTRNNVRSLKMN